MIWTRLNISEYCTMPSSLPILSSGIPDCSIFCCFACSVESLPVHNTEAESPGGGGETQNGGGGDGDVADDHTDARQTHTTRSYMLPTDRNFGRRTQIGCLKEGQIAASNFFTFLGRSGTVFNV